MKSERRHELETNQLADWLARLPHLLYQYGSRILLALALVVLVIVIIYNRSQSRKAEASAALDQLAAARQGIQRLGNYEPLAQSVPADKQADRFHDLVNLSRENLDGAVKQFDQPEQLAEALVAQGDLNWTIANYPQLSASGAGAAAVPAADERTKAMDDARQAYQRVLDNYPQVTMASLSAHMGLAAIAENSANWDEAKKQYQAVADGAQYAPIFQQQAKERLESLDELRKPVLLVQPPEPMVLAPTTAPTTDSVQQENSAATTEAPAADVGAADENSASPASPTTTPATQPSVD